MQGLIPLIVVTFLAGTIQGLVGFGFSLLAASAFLVVVGSGEAVQLLIIINLGISVALVRPLWKDADRSLLMRLLAGAVLGLPVGLMLFRAAEVEQLEAVVGTVILLFVGTLVVSRRNDRNRVDGHDDRMCPVPFPQVRSDHARGLLPDDGAPR